MERHDHGLYETKCIVLEATIVALNVARLKYFTIIPATATTWFPNFIDPWNVSTKSTSIE